MKQQPMKSSLVPCEAHGVRFLRPDIWEFDEVMDDADVIFTVASESTCFWTLRLLPHGESPTDVVDSCVSVFEEEYGDIEVSSVAAHLAEMQAVARQIDFSCLELLNTVRLYSVRTTEFTLLVWWQGTDHELAEFREVLDLMTESVRILSLEE